MPRGTPVRVGVLLDFPQADGGAATEAALRLGIAEVSDAGRLDREVELITRPVAGLPLGSEHEVIEGFRELADTGCLLVVGPSISDNALITTPIGDEIGLVTINYTGGERTRGHFGFHYQVGSLEEEPVALAGRLVERGVERPAVIHDQSPVGRRYAECFDDAATAAGLEVAARRAVSPLIEDAAPAGRRASWTPAPTRSCTSGSGCRRARSRSRWRDATWNRPVLANSALMFGYARPDWRDGWAGWEYLDAIADDNERRQALAAHQPSLAAAPVPCALVDIGRLAARRSPEPITSPARASATRWSGSSDCRPRAGTRGPRWGSACTTTPRSPASTSCCANGGRGAPSRSRVEPRAGDRLAGAAVRRGTGVVCRCGRRRRVGRLHERLRGRALPCRRRDRVGRAPRGHRWRGERRGPVRRRRLPRDPERRARLRRDRLVRRPSACARRPSRVSSACTRTGASRRSPPTCSRPPTTSSWRPTARCSSPTLRRGRSPTTHAAASGRSGATARSTSSPTASTTRTGSASTATVRSSSSRTGSWGSRCSVSCGSRRTADTTASPARTGDGFCFDVDGRLYVAGEIHGVTVLEPDGRIAERLEIPGSGVTTNCCFGGDDLRTLFATEAVPGGLVAWEGMPRRGRAGRHLARPRSCRSSLSHPRGPLVPRCRVAPWRARTGGDDDMTTDDHRHHQDDVTGAEHRRSAGSRARAFHDEADGDPSGVCGGCGWPPDDHELLAAA